MCVFVQSRLDDSVTILEIKKKIVNTPDMRLAILALLSCATLGTAAPIQFSGVFYQGQTTLCCVHGIQLTGTEGFSIEAALPDWGSSIGFCSEPLCDASGTFQVIPFVESGFSASLGGQMIQSSVPSSGTVGGSISYNAPVFAPDCGFIGASCSVSLPINYFGEIWAQFADGSFLYDLAVSGSGTMTTYIQETGGSSFLIQGVNANISGAGSAIPEPASIVLMLTGITLLLGLRVAHRRLQGPESP